MSTLDGPRKRSPRTRMPAPGYFIEGHRFPAVARYRRYGGELDAALQLNQMALLHLKQSAEQSGKTSRVFLGELAKRLSFPVRADSIATAQLAATRSALTSIWSVVESFLDDLRADIKKYRPTMKETWVTERTRGEDLSSLSQHAESLSPAARAAIRLLPEFDLIEHYRLVRNDVIHNNSIGRDVTIRSLDLLFNKHGSYFEKTYGYPKTPHPVEQLTYEDTRLLSRASLAFCNKLNDAWLLTAEEIARFEAASNADLLQMGKLKIQSIRPFHYQMKTVL